MKIHDLRENASGRITKQNTTVDVKPGEIRRQAAKFGNKINNKNEPPLLHAKARKNSDPHTLSNLGLTESVYPIADYDEWYGDRQYKDQGAKMVMMSPDKYLAAVRPLQMDDESEDNIEDLINHIKSGRTLDPLKIYPDGKEDGRHRAYAAKQLGIKQVPVILWPQLKEDMEQIKKPHPKDTLGVKRADMPQVHRDHYPELIQYLADHGNTFTKQEVHATELKPVQSEFSDKGVRKMMKTGGRPSDSAGKDKKPLIVSADNYIVDGHHRWLAAYNLDEVVPIMQSSLPIKQLFQLVKDFRHTTYKDITEGHHNLSESFDNVLPYRWIDPLIAKAIMPNKNQLLITFDKGAFDTYNIEFSVNHETFATGEGHQMTVFATVLAAIRDFTKKNDPAGYRFTAEKFAKERQDTRINLYKRLVLKFADQIGMKFRFDNSEGYQTTFYLDKKSLNESTQLNELFNNVYDWKWGYKPTIATFITDDGGEVVVGFSQLQKSSPNYEVSFSKNDNIKRTGEGDQFKIIATVIEVIKAFIQKNPKLELLTFTAKREGRELENRKFKNKRAALYKRMLGRFASQHGFEFHEDEVGRMTEFYLVKKPTNEQFNTRFTAMEWACIEGGHDLNDLKEIRLTKNLKNDDAMFGRMEAILQQIKDGEFRKVQSGSGVTSWISNDISSGGYVLLTDDDLSIIYSSLMLKGEMNGALIVGMSWTHPKHRRKGHSSALYQTVLAAGHNIRSDGEQTRGSQGVWKTLYKRYKTLLYRENQLVTQVRDDQDFAKAYRRSGQSDGYYLVMQSPTGKTMENMSVTGTARAKEERKRKLTPGSEAWFKHWFGRPYLKREDVDRLKEEAAQYVKEKRYAKKTRRRKVDRN